MIFLSQRDTKIIWHLPVKYTHTLHEYCSIQLFKTFNPMCKTQPIGTIIIREKRNSFRSPVYYELYLQTQIETRII